LLQCIIDADWRLQRIPVLEAGIFAVGRRELADTVPADVLEAEVYLKYERNLKNLSLQENRLRRARETDIVSLKALQTARLEREAVNQKLAQMKAKQHPSAQPEPQIGFVFATPQIPTETNLETNNERVFTQVA
jgi:hypothetical protein